MLLVVSTFVPIHLPTWRPLDEGRGLAQLVLAGTPHRSCHRYSSQLAIPAMTVVHMQQHLHQATGSLPTARPVLSRPAVVTRAAPSPTSMSVSLSGPGQAAEARTDTARGGVASTSVPASTYSSSPDSIKAFLEAELPRLFSEGVCPCKCRRTPGTCAQLPCFGVQKPNTVHERLPALIVLSGCVHAASEPA